MISIKGGYAYSTILDYDGFIRKAVDEIGIQYVPNIGGTSVIAAYNKNANIIMMRISWGEDVGYFFENAGKTQKKMENVGGFGGGRGAITVIGDEKYRFFHACWKKLYILIIMEELGKIVLESLEKNLMFLLKNLIL